MKIKVDLKSTITFILVFLISFLAFYFLISHHYSKPSNYLYYKGNLLIFIQPLQESSKIKLYPNDQSIRNLLFNKNISKITIYFKPSIENGLYSKVAFEISYKLLRYVYPSYGLKPKIEGKEISSYSLIKCSSENPALVLVHPQFANSTFVKLENCSIWISGTSKEKFEKASVRFLIAAMDIHI